MSTQQQDSQRKGGIYTPFTPLWLRNVANSAFFGIVYASQPQGLKYFFCSSQKLKQILNTTALFELHNASCFSGAFSCACATEKSSSPHPAPTSPKYFITQGYMNTLGEIKTTVVRSFSL